MRSFPFLILGALAACGGGGSSAASTPTNNPHLTIIGERPKIFERD